MALKKISKKRVISEDEVTTFDFLRGYKDKDGVLHKDFDLVEITGAEEEAISKQAIKNNGAKIIRVLLSRCITRIGTIRQEETKKDDWENIIKSLDVFDQDYAYLKLREISKGKELELKHSCPQCKKELHSVIDTDEFEIEPWNGLEQIDFMLPKGIIDKDGNVHKKGVLRLPQGLDREILTPIAQQNMGHGVTLMLTRCIQSIEGIDVVTEEMVRKLKIMDRDYLNKLLQENKYGMDTTVELTCPICGYEFEGDLNTINFI